MINNEHTHEREPTRLQVHTTHLIPQHHIARDEPLCPGPRILAQLLLDRWCLLYTDCFRPCTFLAGRSEVAAARTHGVAHHLRIVDRRWSGTVFSAPLLLWLARTRHRRRVKEFPPSYEVEVPARVPPAVGMRVGKEMCKSLRASERGPRSYSSRWPRRRRRISAGLGGSIWPRQAIGCQARFLTPSPSSASKKKNLPSCMLM